MRSLIALVFLTLSLYAVTGHGEVLQCGRTEIVYANGVLNEPSDALESLIALYKTIEAYPTVFSSEERAKLDGTLAFNPTKGTQIDVMEALDQAVISSETEKWRKMLTDEDLSESEREAIRKTIAKAILQGLQLANSQPQLAQVLLDHVKEYRKLIDSGKKVVVVAHSQGNFFANQAYYFLSPTQQPAFAIVAVASPDSYVAKSTTPHVTQFGDSVINDLVANQLKELGYPAPLEPNTPNSKITGHDFIDSYLEAGSESAKRIVSYLKSNIDALRNPLCAQSNQGPRVALLVRSQTSLDAEEAHLKQFLETSLIQHTVVDATSIKNGTINLADFGVLYMRTGAEPVEYQDPSVVALLAARIKNGARLITEYYATYLAQYLDAGTVSMGAWGPVVTDVHYFVEPVGTNPLFTSVPVWSPPTLPDRNENLIASLKAPRAYNFPVLIFSTTPRSTPYNYLVATYGWPNQRTDSEYCGEHLDVCTSDRSVYRSDTPNAFWPNGSDVESVSYGNGQIVKLGPGMLSGIPVNELNIGPVANQIRANAIAMSDPGRLVACDIANPRVPCEIAGTAYDTFAGNYSGNRSFYKAGSYDFNISEGYLCLSIKAGLPHNHGYAYATNYGATVWTSPPPYNVNFGIFGQFSGSCVEQANNFEWIGVGRPN